MNKHTPGPWKQEDRTVFYGAPINYGGRIIAECGQSTNPEIDKANARLIAAAPELLEACKLAMELFPKEMRGSLVESAIAKAEGKE